YDNGWLLRLYADAWAITREPLFERVCRETAAWVMREMQSPAGGYYSSLDADSEGEEGKFYVWEPEEVRKLLTPEEFAVASIVFGLDRPPNFENRHWHLTIARPAAEAARAMEVNEGAVQALIESTREKLRAARQKRARPRLGTRYRDRAHGKISRPRSGRLLLHRARPRAAHPPPQARARQCDAVRQRGRGPRAQPARIPRRRCEPQRSGRGYDRALL